MQFIGSVGHYFAPAASTSAAPNQNTEANIKALPKAQFGIWLILLIDYKNDCHSLINKGSHH